MTITALPRLPPELVLLVAEHGARSEVFTRTSRMARLCLVCKAFRRVVTPILYDHITLDDDTYGYFFTISSFPDTPLVHTRSVLFVSDPRTVNTKPPFESIARALVNISAFTGPTRALAELPLTISSAYLTDVVIGPKIAKTQRVVNTLTRLHIICGVFDDLSGLDLSSSHVEYLAIDLFSDTIGEGSISLSPMTSHWEAKPPPQLRRVLLRLRPIHESDVQRVTQKIVEWAKDRCDQRIYVDDTFVPVRDAGGKWLRKELDKQDARDGDSLWLRGRQAWCPQPRIPDWM